MVFSVLILTVGIPGAGKSTWVKKYLKDYPYTHVVSTDEIRKELTGVMQCDPNQNEWIHDEARERVKELLAHPERSVGMGPVIIVDSTNVDLEEWVKYKALGASVIVAQYFEISIDEAMKRQKGRERYVPRHVIESKFHAIERNKKFMPYIFNTINTIKCSPNQE